TALDDRLTRGGPLVRVPGAWNFSASYFGDRRKHYLLQGNLQATGGRANPGAGGDVQLTVQPTPTFSFVLAPAFSWSKTRAQYLTTTADSLATGTYRHRYVFAELVQRQLALVTRINWTFTPRLSFQLFAQPLLASGRYERFKELAAPRSFDFSGYGKDQGSIQRANGTVSIDPDGLPGTLNTISFGEPNFSLRSLRGNAVLRWEYQPGSSSSSCGNNGARMPRRSEIFSSDGISVRCSRHRERISLR
ncbi:MAG TPA: hypothetical protein VGQ73_00315, partial [Gemmatimonadales bacterium]|nr:hypothetical protein [Gemmatimonadales bacterium]